MKLKKKILMVIAHRQFRDEEYDIPKTQFVQKHFDVRVASTNVEIPAKGMLGGEATADLLLEHVRVDEYDAVVFVGGEGAKSLWENKGALKVCVDAVKEKKILAAICLAPVILANAGVLEGKRATVFPSEQARILMRRGIYTGKTMEQDGKIITANGPSCSEVFARKILSELELIEAAPEEGAYTL